MSHTFEQNTKNESGDSSWRWDESWEISGGRGWRQYCNFNILLYNGVYNVNELRLLCCDIFSERQHVAYMLSALYAIARPPSVWLSVRPPVRDTGGSVENGWS